MKKPQPPPPDNPSPYKVYVRNGITLAPDNESREFVSVNQARSYAAWLSRGPRKNEASVIFNAVTGEFGPIYQNGKQLEWRFNLFLDGQPFGKTESLCDAQKLARSRLAKKGRFEIEDMVHGFRYVYRGGCEVFD